MDSNIITNGFKDEFNVEGEDAGARTFTPGQTEPTLENTQNKTQEQIDAEAIAAGGDLKLGDDYVKDIFKEDTKPDDPNNLSAEEAEQAQKKSLENVNSLFGTSFNNMDEIEAYKAKFSSVEEREKELDILKRQTINPFANDEIRKLNAFTKETGINNMGIFDKIDKANLNEMDPLDAMVLSKIIENPQYIGKEDLLRRTFESNYKLEELDGDERELAEMRMRLDSENAVKHISEVKGKIPQEFQDNSADIIESRKNLEKNWSTKIDTMSESVEPIVVKSTNDKGEEVEVLKFDISKDEIKPHIDAVVKSYIDQGVEISEKNIKEVINIATGFYKQDNLAKIILSAQKVANSEGERNTMRRAHNPSDITVTSRDNSSNKDSNRDFNEFTRKMIAGEAID
jgi:hypothetical protein